MGTTGAALLEIERHRRDALPMPRQEPLQAAIRRVLAGPEGNARKQAYRDLLLQAWDPMDQGIRAAPRKLPGCLGYDEIWNAFVEEKLLDRRFLVQTAGAREPSAYLWTAAYNYALGKLGSAPHLEPFDVDGPGTARTEPAPEQESPTWLHHLLQDLTPGEKALLAVVLVDCWPEAERLVEQDEDTRWAPDVPDWLEQVIIRIANRRGVKPATVNDELVVRRDRLVRSGDKRRDAWVDSAMKRAWRIGMLSERIRRCSEVLAEREAGQQEPTRPSRWQDDKMPRTWSRKVLLGAMTKRLEEWRGRLIEERRKEVKRLHDERLLGGRNVPRGWQEVGRILGKVHDGKTDHEKAKAINCLTVRYRKACAKLRKRMAYPTGSRNHAAEGERGSGAEIPGGRGNHHG